MSRPTGRWVRSSYSSAAGANCVEVLFATASLAVRDSKNPAGPTLSFPTPAWHAFLSTLRPSTPA
ncbi:DUF397 domain-containing protein [Kutzneria buriramensis]|uniref:Uncharacterized protein DUF397 n=1 Tax=Kutzneria buriramensis TaxID=1045776 RepID=A0A3E0I9P3_9PSEU|nr:DUF397 domain-containing protein [Kutzneria buriramensis]REH55454.1 uncharacterized protein DUF397 [Kutzneria buriramensis]